MTNKWYRYPIPVLVILLAVFVVPIFIARWAFNHQDTFGKTTNYGELIQPPIKLAAIKLLTIKRQPVEQQQLQGKWLYLYIGQATCKQACIDALYKMRQIRLATGKNMNRIECAVITPLVKKTPELTALLHNQYAGTQHFATDSSDLPLTTGWLYLADPLGNIMLRYAPDSNPSLMLKDIERLLRVSQIG